MLKIKIDLSLGIFEAEGGEEIVEKLYKDFRKESFDTKQYGDSGNKKENCVIESKTGSSHVVNKTKNGVKRKESYSIVTDLNLMPSGKESLKEFYHKKMPSSGMERATVFVYYLEKIAEIKGITPAHIYTCYKEVGIPVPKALKQSLLDAASRKGSIDTSSLTDITMTTVGENMVEHSLPSKKED